MPPHVETSIIITTYNHERYIANAIESVLEGLPLRAEVVIIDDGSTDDTYSIAKSLENDSLSCWTKTNGGPSSAINRGLDLARGEFITFLSGDDENIPGSIQKRLNYLRNRQLDLIATVPLFMDDNGNQIEASDLVNVFRVQTDCSPLKFFMKLYRIGNFVCAPSVLMRRSIVHQIGLFDESLWQLQDYDYWLRCTCENLKMEQIRSEAIRYRVHSGNLSTRNPLRLDWELDKVLLSAATRLPADKINEAVFGDYAVSGSFANLPIELMRALLLSQAPSRNIKAVGRAKLLHALSTQEKFEEFTRRMCHYF